MGLPGWVAKGVALSEEEERLCQKISTMASAKLLKLLTCWGEEWQKFFSKWSKGHKQQHAQVSVCVGVVMQHSSIHVFPRN